MTRRPDLFIIGAAKSGTTSLYEYLAGHPEVFMSPMKEPFYFSPDVQGGTRKRLAHPEGKDEYLELFARARQEKRVGEASTRYIVSKMAPSLVRDFQPGARVVAILRNPIDMMHSLHSDRVSAGTEKIVDFDEALAADKDRLAGRLLRPGQTPEYAAYRTNARYGEQLGRWFQIFDRQQIHVIAFDDFAADTPATFRRLLEFLEVDPDYAPRSFAPKRRSHRPRGGILRSLIRSRPAKWMTERLLPATVGANATSSLVWRFRQSRLNRRRHVRPDISPELRRQLEHEFAPDIARLSELIGRDMGQLWLRHAGQPPRAPDR